MHSPVSPAKPSLSDPDYQQPWGPKSQNVTNGSEIGAEILPGDLVRADKVEHHLTVAVYADSPLQRYKLDQEFQTSSSPYGKMTKF